MSVVIDGTSGVTTPGVVNTAGETIATTLVVTGVTTLTGGLNAALPVLSGGTGVTTKTGTGAVVLGTNPTITGATITVAATAAPAFSAYANVGTSLIGPAFTKVLYQVELYDTNNNFASSTFTPTVAGYYLINGSATLAAAGNENSIAIYKNGSIFAQGLDITTTSLWGITISRLVYCNGTTDYIEIYAYVTNSRTGGNGPVTVWFDGSMIRSA